MSAKNYGSFEIADLVILIDMSDMRQTADQNIVLSNPSQKL